MSLRMESELPSLLAFATVSLLNRRRAHEAVRALLLTHSRLASRGALYHELAVLCAQRLDRGGPDADLMHAESVAEIAPRRRGQTVLCERCGFGAAEAANIARTLPDYPQILAA
jgi:hypothetical protein